MINRLIALAALVAAAVTLGIVVTQPAANPGVTSCARIAYDYVAQAAKANGLRINSYRLLACRKTDQDHTVARVHIVVSPQGFPKGVLVQDVTIVYHLTRSDWQVSDVHPVG